MFTSYHRSSIRLTILIENVAHSITLDKWGFSATMRNEKEKMNIETSVVLLTIHIGCVEREDESTHVSCDGFLPLISFHMALYVGWYDRLIRTMLEDKIIEEDKKGREAKEGKEKNHGVMKAKKQGGKDPSHNFLQRITSSVQVLISL